MLLAPETHPVSLIPIFDRLVPVGQEHDYEFSKYIYVPQAVAESREVFKLGAKNLSEAFSARAQALRGVEEIAFHSRISFSDGSVFHIPMVDMGCEKIENHIDGLRSAFDDFGIPQFTLFSSGRSFHIYGHALLKPNDLIRFLGRILLLNLPGKEHVIDERWVGHRLMAGYSTLRWTNNNPHYKSTPFKLRTYS
jgi:hypothetical protein